MTRPTCPARGAWRPWLDGLDPWDGAALESRLFRALVLAALETATTRDAGVGEAVAARLEEIDEEFRESLDEAAERYQDRLDELVDHWPADWAEEWLDDVLEERPGEPLTSFEMWAVELLGEFLRAGRRRHGDATADPAVAWVGAALGRSQPGIVQQARLLGGPGLPKPLDLDALLSGSLLAERLWLAAGFLAVIDPDGTGRRTLLDGWSGTAPGARGARVTGGREADTPGVAR